MIQNEVQDENLYTTFFQRLLEMSRWQNAFEHQSECPQYKTVTKKKGFWIFAKEVEEQVEIKIDPNINVVNKKIEDLIENYSFLFPVVSYNPDYPHRYMTAFVKKTLTYDRLWNFCEFVKLAEYIILYPNSPDNNFYIEAGDFQFSGRKHIKGIKDDTKRSIIIKEDDYFNLRIELEQVDDELSRNTMKIIKLILERKYIKSKPQVVICIDEISDDNIGSADTMFLQNINDMIYDKCYEVFKNITNSIIEGSGVTLE